MGRIVAIGGGDIKYQTTRKIDEFIISLANKNSPKVLFLPTASVDNENYIEQFMQYYKELGCDVDVLKLSIVSNDNLIRSKIFASDIIYIGGGNTARMMRIFKRTHVNEYLKLAYERNIVLCGLSAGCAIYFTNCYSDSNRSTNSEASLCLVKCLDILKYMNSPHYNNEERKGFDEFARNHEIDGIAIDDDVAVYFEDEKIIKSIKSNPNNKAYLITKDDKIEIKD